MNVICLAIDRLHAAYLGAYGNSWINTPNFDRLAAESVLLDRMTIDEPDLKRQYRSLWQGIHAMCRAARADEQMALAAAFSAAGWQSVLVADDQRITENPLAAGFSDVIQTAVDVARKKGPARTVSHLDETEAAGFFAAAGECVQSAMQPFFLWLHTGTLGRIWDAPLEFREQYADEDDPAVGDWAEVPNRMLPENFDPDQRVAVAHAYAGQVSAIDQMLGAFLDQLDQQQLRDSTLLVVFSTRGFPLGEHRRIGPCDEALYAELTHVPCLMRLPRGESAGQRFGELVQPADLPSSILALTGLEPWSAEAVGVAGMGRSLVSLVRGEPTKPFNRACTIGPGNQRLIVTPAWSMRATGIQQVDAEAESAVGVSQSSVGELFVKPDDWFEINDVADRCPEVVEKLRSALDEFETACQTGAPTPTELPDELIERVE